MNVHLDGSAEAGRALHHWHPFSSMPAAAQSPLEIARGEGARVWDVDGNAYIDATAALWYCNIGHGRRELADAAHAQMVQLAGYQTFGDLTNAPVEALADRLCSLSPFSGRSAAFLVSGGSDAVDSAGKMVRRYWQLRGMPERTIIVSRRNSYHGMHAYGTSLAGIPANAGGWGTIIPDTRLVDPHDPAELERLLADEGDRIAAFIGEPVIGAGGVVPPADGYWPRVRELCDAHDVLLIADEVVSGFGRLGTWFASEHFEIRPDIITCAKGVTSGYLPLGAVLVGDRVLDVLWGEDAPVFRHGYTYSGHPTACAVALANIDILEREDVLGHARRMAPVLDRELRALADHPLVGEVRTAGMLGAVEFDEMARTERPSLADDVAVAARRHGVLTRALVGIGLQISPALVISEEQIVQMAAGLRAALDHVSAPVA